MRIPHRIVALLLASLSPAALTQAPKPAADDRPLPPVGSVSGTITCTDTQRPARFAEVFLLRKTDGQTAEDSPNLSLVHGRSGLDGTFTLSHIAVGDYYAIPKAPGYLVPLVPPDHPPTPNELMKDDPDLSHALANFPLVHVAADRGTHVDLTLQRGAVISGRATYDDGSPVAGMEVNLKPTEKEDATLQNLGENFRFFVQGDKIIRTDDDGRYRIAGVPPGKYIISMKLETEANDRTSASGEHDFFTHTAQSETTIYSPGAFHQDDARVIDVTRDRGRDDADIVVRLSGLHTVSGVVLAGEDRHRVSAGQLSLIDNAGFYLTNIVQPDGTFRFSYIPEGTYQLNIFRGADAKPADQVGGLKASKTYGRVTLTVLVGEHDVVLDDIQLPDAVPNKKPPNP